MSAQSTVVRRDGASLLRIESSLLVVTRGVDEGVEHELLGQPVVVGRGGDAELRLTDPTVSRAHARLEPAGSGWLVRDLGSAGGTRVDGVEVAAAPVGPGQIVRVGETELTLAPVAREFAVATTPGEGFEGMVARCEAMRELFSLVRRVAPLDLPVLVTGEPGTGKEGLARALHQLGPRASGPYEVVDCTLLADPEAMRSELFGHTRGAFSGAVATRRGAFERGHRGTLFLDEVGELPLALQPQLLRVLQEGEVRPLGAEGAIRVRVRVVAATNRDLAAMVAAGRFRADLLHRLGAVRLVVPPLRDRGEDLGLLARHFLPAGVTLAPDAVEALGRHPWPGNVRELGFVLRAAVALRGGSALGVEVLRLVPPAPVAASLRPPAPEPRGGVDPEVPLVSERHRVRRITDEEILAALEQAQGNRAEAARRLGMGRSTFFRRLQRIEG